MAAASGRYAVCYRGAVTLSRRVSGKLYCSCFVI